MNRSGGVGERGDKKGVKLVENGFGGLGGKKVAMLGAES